MEWESSSECLKHSNLFKCIQSQVLEWNQRDWQVLMVGMGLLGGMNALPETACQKVSSEVAKDGLWAQYQDWPWQKRTLSRAEGCRLFSPHEETQKHTMSRRCVPRSAAKALNLSVTHSMAVMMISGRHCTTPVPAAGRGLHRSKNETWYKLNSLQMSH